MATSKFWQRIVAVLAIPAFRLPSRSVFARASPLKAKDMVYDWDSVSIVLLLVASASDRLIKDHSFTVHSMDPLFR
jgi:hypothetical protein